MKLVVCDVEGTIFSARYKIDGMDYASTMWQPLARSLGEEGVRREKELHDKWEREEFREYLDWVEATCLMHKELGLTRQTFEYLISCAEYNLGVKEFFEKLDRKKFIPVLISGGFQELVRSAQNELNIPHGHGACEYAFDKTDDLLSSYNLVSCDFQGKYKFVKILLDRYGLDANLDWIFIGDGKNDCDIAEKCPISFAFNGHPKLKAVTTYHIDDSADAPASFRAIAQIIEALTEEDYKEGCRQKNNRLQAKAITAEKQKKSKVQRSGRIKVEVKNEDYYKRPDLHLSEILEGYSIAFIGLQEHYAIYRKLKERFARNKNFKLIEANFEHKNNMDNNSLKRRQFIFIDVDCISHSQGWRADDLGVPFAEIEHQPGMTNDIEPFERVMSNILFRYFYEERGDDEN